MVDVLVVDDAPEQRDLLCALLMEDGHDVAAAVDGRDALARVHAAPPQVIVMDVDMPALDGVAACRALKEDAGTRFIPVIMVTGLGDLTARRRCREAGCDDFLAKPIDPPELCARVAAALRLKSAIDQLEDAENVLFSLARALEAKDPYTAGHSERVSVLAQRLGQVSGVSAEQLVHLGRAALLHDLGKIGTPQELLCKPGRLTLEELRVVRLHPVVGEAICRPLRVLAPTLALIRGHHERLDGSGYPDGLDAPRIPLALRCLTLADVYDALTSNRPYRRSLTAAHALDMMREEARAGAWDADLVEALARLVGPDAEPY